MEQRASVDCGAVASHRRNEGEEEKNQKALAWVAPGSMSFLLVGLMAFMAGSHGDAPLWLVSELCAVLCLQLYLWAYHLTQSISAAVQVDALVFAFPLIFSAGFVAALLAVTVGPMAGVLVMVADVACTSVFFGFCLAEHVRYNMSLARKQEQQTWTEKM